MRLSELEPQFVRYETRREPVSLAVGDPATWRQRGCPTMTEVRDVEYSLPAKTLKEAQGIRFLCPACFQKNGGVVGTHIVDVAFEGRGVFPSQGSHNKKGEPSRWNVTGTDYSDLTLQPSIDCECWHGLVTNGEVK